MKIPSKLKVGGKVYDVEQTMNLVTGNANSSAEIDYHDTVIRIVPHSQSKMETDFFHEMTHAMFDFMGYTDHDEEVIDKIANVLYMVVQDNPEIFERSDKGVPEKDEHQLKCK